MKKIFTLFVIIAMTISVAAQSPQKMSYQAVVRNNSGVLLANQAVGMRISILHGSATGTPVYVETQTTTTNANGLATIEIGGGTIVTGAFAGIDWSNGTYFIKTETDPTGGTSYTITGTSQILSVPYALYAKTAKTANYNDLTNKPTTLSGYGITDAVSVSGTQTISGETTFKGTTADLEAPLFEVKNKDGQTIFAVYNEGVRIWVSDGNKGTKGGFAVGGFDMTKQDDAEFLRVTPDSVKVSKSLLIPRMTTQERDNLPFAPGEAMIIFNLTDGCMQIFKNEVWSNIWCFNCAPSFIIQPVNNTICSGNNASFFISATGTNLTYQWQESTDGGLVWNSITDGGTNPTYTGVTTTELTLTNVPVEYNTHKYRCVVFGTCRPDAISNFVILNVGSTSSPVTMQPIDQQLSDECSANFNISTLGYGITLQWQESSDGGNTWKYVTDGGTNPVYSGSTSANLSLSNVPMYFNNYKYRCIISNACGPNITSNSATLATNTSAAILSQPSNSSVYAGQNTSFSITTSGGGFTFQWQVSIDGGNSWSNIINGGSNPLYSGTNTSTLSLLNVPISCNNYKYRCVITHLCRDGATSEAATLSVPSVTDVDGNTYTIIGIGSQIWMAENLKTTKYNDGTSIPYSSQVTSIPSYCYYNNDEATYKNTYGSLYNGRILTTSKNVCPTGWHIPTKDEVTTLIGYLGGSNVAGGKMKESGTSHWLSPNIGATNESGFKGLPGGFNWVGDVKGGFTWITKYGFWWFVNWTSAPMVMFYDSPNATTSLIYIETGYPVFEDYNYCSIRCIKD